MLVIIVSTLVKIYFELNYPLVSRQNELTKIDQSNCAVWRRRKGKWPVFGKNNLKISGGEWKLRDLYRVHQKKTFVSKKITKNAKNYRMS